MAPSVLPKASATSFIHLGMARGAAALLVLLGHLRSFIFVSYGDLKSHGPIDTFIWTITGFGHQAVMIFFVLSGFFITRSILMDDRSKGFSWPIYLIKRLSRLWIVLLPCLILTLLWDTVGMSASGTKFYAGELYPLYNSGPNLETGGAHLEASTFFGNLFFLQTIIVPIFGSNGPLWSLANEFWYYLMFPFLFIAATRRSKPVLAVINFGLLVAVCIFVGEYMALSGLIWLGGALVYLVYDREWFASALRTPAALGIAVVLLLASLAFSKGHFGSELAKDFFVGFGSAALVLVLARFEGANNIYRKAAAILADGSYTMYLVHFPFMAVIVNLLLNNQKFDASAAGYFVFFAVGLVTLLYCYAIYWLFERHTGRLRRYCITMYKGIFASAVKN